MKVSEFFQLWRIEILTLMIAVGIVMFIFLSLIGVQFARHRNTSPRNACQENQTRIDGAVSQFMIENNYKSFEDALANGLVLDSFIGEDNYLIKMPKCPERGKYSILITKGAHGETVKCSLEEHFYPTGS